MKVKDILKALKKYKNNEVLIELDEIYYPVKELNIKTSELDSNFIILKLTDVTRVS